MESPLCDIDRLGSGKGQVDCHPIVRADIYRIPGCIEVITVGHVMPDLHITCEVSDLGIEFSGIGSFDLVMDMISMSRDDGQASVTELTAPPVFSAVRSSAGIDYRDTVNTVFYLEFHFSGSGLAYMPRKSLAGIEIILPEHLPRTYVHGKRKHGCHHL